MNRKTASFLIIGMTGLAALAIFNLIGSSIDEQGVLREPLFLLPIGYLLSLIGFGGAMLLAAIRVFRSEST